MPKDLFSNHAAVYSKFRPGYPKELFDYIISFVESKRVAWDCATGNGQAAAGLADHFENVIASDISPSQIENAIRKRNIEYYTCPAELTPFAENTFDLITIAQAYHWLNWDKLRKEVMRVGKPNAVIAAWMYNRLTTNDDRINEIYNHFYEQITDPYWEPERKFVDENYTTVQFDFANVTSKQFITSVNWDKELFEGYLSTWSAVQKYIRVNGSSPLLLIKKQIDAVWPAGETKAVQFPIFLITGRVSK